MSLSLSCALAAIWLIASSFVLLVPSGRVARRFAAREESGHGVASPVFGGQEGDLVLQDAGLDETSIVRYWCSCTTDSARC
jgi:hypothetical protein